MSTISTSLLSEASSSLFTSSDPSVNTSSCTVCRIIHNMLDIFVDLRHLINGGSIADHERVQMKFSKRGQSRAFTNFVGAFNVLGVGMMSILTIVLLNTNACRCKFTDAFIGYPGSVHDTQVFQNSPLYRDKFYPLHIPRR